MSEHYASMVKSIYNLTYAQACAAISCKFTAEERSVWWYKAKQVRPTAACGCHNFCAKNMSGVTRALLLVDGAYGDGRNPGAGDPQSEREQRLRGRLLRGSTRACGNTHESFVEDVGDTVCAKATFKLRRCDFNIAARCSEKKCS